ncbi:MAG: host attachment family protein [Parvularculaceae bacterium]|nr:host attachment family protein [Parvularculaceae bacterium]
MATTWVAVADGSKALLFENTAGDLNPSLRLLGVEELDNPPSRTIGADRAGRMNDGRAGGVRKSAFAATDYHQLAEDRFAARFAAALDKAAGAGAFDRLFVAAPPTTLGALRAAFGGQTRSRIAFEVASDLVNHPVDAIERHLGDAWDKRKI